MDDALLRNPSDPSANDAKRELGWKFGAVLLVLLGTISIGISGFRIDNNNIYHLLILERAWAEPQFATDVFVQSLQYFASGFWQLLIGVAKDTDVSYIFLPMLLVSRIILIAGVAWWLPMLGLRGRQQAAVFMIACVINTMWSRYSFAGWGGIMPSSFTHSELGNGLALITLSLVWRRRYNWALACAGLIFFINIFLAVWLAPLMITVLALKWREHEMTAGHLVRACWPGVLACAAFAVPILAVLAKNPELGRSPDYDFRVFLVEFFPDHFLASHLAPIEYVGFALVIATALTAGSQLEREPRRLIFSLTSVLLVIWAIGAILPLMTSSPTLLNLHLLRSTTYLQMVAVLALSAMTTRWMTSEDRADRFLWGPLVLLSAAAKVVGMAILIPVLLIRRLWRPGGWIARPVLAVVLLSLCGVSVAVKIVQARRADAAFWAANANWHALAVWAKTQTPADMIFLLPVVRGYDRSPQPREPTRMGPLLMGWEDFPTLSHRQVWVMGKYGAAALWQPSYYHLWHERMLGSLAASSLSQRLAYARSNGIGMVVDSCADAAANVPAYRSGDLCVFPSAE